MSNLPSEQATLVTDYEQALVYRFCEKDPGIYAIVRRLVRYGMVQEPSDIFAVSLPSKSQSLGPPDSLCPKCGAYVMNPSEDELARQAVEIERLLAEVERLKADLAALRIGDRKVIAKYTVVDAQAYAGIVGENERLRAALERIAANNDFLFLAEMAEFAREALAPEPRAKCEICGSEYAPLARCACGKNPKRKGE